MDKLLALHRILTLKTSEELMQDEIKRVQKMLIEYFMVNKMEFSDNCNFVVYNETDSLIENMYSLAKTSNLTQYDFLNMFIDEKGCISKPKNQLNALNDKIFIQRLLNLLIPNIDLDLRIKVKKEYVYDYKLRYSLQFKFYLKDNVNYDGGSHKVVDSLLLAKKLKEEKEKEEGRTGMYSGETKNLSSEIFNKICDHISNKYEADKQYYDEYNLTMYEISALLTIMGIYDKYTTIQYDYTWYGLNIDNNFLYEFTEDEQKVLSLLLGVSDKTLKITYNNGYISIIFDKNDRLTSSKSLLDSCKLKLEESRNIARKALLEFVENEKDNIINTCCNMLKYYKFSHSPFKNKYFPLNDSFCVVGMLVCDPEIITPEITERINSILETSGVSVFIKERYDVNSINEDGEAVSPTPDVLKITTTTYCNNISLKLPRVLDITD